MVATINIIAARQRERARLPARLSVLPFLQLVVSPVV